MASSRASSYMSLQMLFMFNIWYFVFFFIVENCVFWWKDSCGSSRNRSDGTFFKFICLVMSYMLPYKERNWYGEYFGLWMFVGLETLRIYFGMKGNLTKHVRLLVVSIILTMVSIACYCYYLIAQTYVLRIEDVLLVITIVIEGLELVLCLLAALRFSNQVAEFAKNE